jgi:hypothetical protein
MRNSTHFRDRKGKNTRDDILKYLEERKTAAVPKHHEEEKTGGAT